MADRTAARARLRRRAGARRLHRRHRRQAARWTRSRAGIAAAAARARRRSGGSDAARAIMTTDPFPKEAAVDASASAARTFTVGGMAKGSGMIEPMMATMLGFVTTDAAVRAGAAAARAARRGRRHVQRHHRRRRVLDQRLRVRCWPTARAASTIDEASYAALVEALRARVPSRWRSASSAAARARPSWSRST